MWNLRAFIARNIIGKDTELASLCLLQCLKWNNALPSLGETTSVIEHRVRNELDGSKVYQIKVNGLLSLSNDEVTK